MKITKRTIDKAINFLETIPEEGFCRNSFHTGDLHCSAGWLFTKGAPFNYCETREIGSLCVRVLGEHLVVFNDEAPEGQIKATVINALCLLKENL